jgi:hypothetical protein
MVPVTTDAVRRRLKLSEEDIADEDVWAFIEDAAAWISEQARAGCRTPEIPHHKRRGQTCA